MQVDDKTVALYQLDAKDLLPDIVSGEKDAPWVMRRDDKSGMCVRLEGGWCGIHKKLGEKFLGDACYFYPRVTRSLGDANIMTATPSCPEVVRLMLNGDDAFTYDEADAERLPNTLRNVLPEGLSTSDALSIHNAFIDTARDQTIPVERAFLRIASVARSLPRIDIKSWVQAVQFYLKTADARLPEAQTHEADPFNLLHALSGLIVASQKPCPPRLAETIGDMERALHVSLDWQSVQINTTPESAGAYQRIEQAWKDSASQRYENLLRMWLQSQLSVSLFPFAGLGSTLEDRITIIGVRMATLRLALMCGVTIHGHELSQDTVVRIVQSLSRFIDHLGDPAFSLQIYEETGWNREARMRGLINN